GWTFGELPERITVTENQGIPLYAWPGLQVEEEHVHVRLFRSQEAERRARRPAIQRLVAMELRRDLGWLQKDLRALAGLSELTANFCSSDDLQASAFEHLQEYLLPRQSFPVLTEA